MAQYEGVEKTIVIANGEGEDKYLCGYFTLKHSSGADITGLRNYLIEKLPAYMVPSYLITLDSIPLTPNGKTDLSALPAPDENKQKNPAEKKDKPKLSPAEKKMASAWEKVLKTDKVGPDDDFFDLGGDSMAIIRIQVLIYKYSMTIRTQDFYENRTLRKICLKIKTKGERGRQRYRKKRE